MDMEQVYRALTVLRVPLQRGEYDLHRLVGETLAAAGIAAEHEKKLAPRCRIDFLCGGVGVEIKRGKPGVARLLPQLARYCACEEVAGLILVSEGSVRLPATLAGKPLRNLCLNQLWGIAL